MLTPTIRKNLEVLAEAIKAHPAELFDLSKYMQVKDCGTLYCSAGLAATLPHFQQQGMRIDEDRDVYVDGEFIAFSPADGSSPTDVLFGTRAFYRLFAGYGSGIYDSRLVNARGYSREYNRSVTDQELALFRIDQHIKFLEQEC